MSSRYLDSMAWLQVHIGISSGFGMDCIHWDPKGQELLGIKDAKKISKKIKTLVAISVNFMALSAILYRTWAVVNDTGMMKNIVSVTMATTFLAPIPYAIVGFLRGSEIAACFNTITRKELTFLDRNLQGYEKGVRVLQLGWKIMRKPKKSLKKLIKIYNEDMKIGTFVHIIYTAGIYTIISVPGMVATLLLVQPCSISCLLRASLDDCPVAAGIVGLPATWYWKLVTISLDAFVGGFSLNNASHHIVITLNHACVAIGAFFERIRKTDVKSDEDVYKCAMEYKEVLLIQKMLNNIMESSILPYILVDVNAVSILSLFGILGLHSQLNHATIFLFTILAVDCAFLVQLVCYKSAADVNELSLAVLDKWTSNPKILGRKLTRKTIRACVDARIRIGNSGNFMEKMTPLVLLDFTIAQVASLLLAT